MMQQQQPIPRGLQALMQVQRDLRTLQTQAAPMTPDGRPTIAAQTQQAAMQQMQPPAPPQGMPGGPGMMQGDPYRQQMMQTLQAQAQAQMAGQQPQPPQPQQPPQGMAHGGIASLRADNIARMKYAKGGVIGFAGEEGSEVPEAESPIGRWLQNFRGKGKEQSEAEQLKQALIARYGAASAVPGLFMAQSDVERQRAKDIMGMLPKLDPEQMRNLLGMTATRQGDTAAWEGAGPGESAGNVPPAAPQAAPRATPRPTPASAPTAPRVAPAATRPVGNVATPAAPQAAPTPSFAEIMGQAGRAMPEDPAIANIRRLQTQKEALAGQRPDIEGMGIAALQQHAAGQQQALEAARKQDQIRRITAFGRDLYGRTGGAGLERVDDLIDQRERAANDAKLVTAQMVLKQQEAAHLRKVGDIDGAMAVEKQIADMNEKRMGHVIQAAHASAQLTGTLNTAASHLQGVRETNAMHLQVEKMKQANQLGILDLRKQAAVNNAMQAVSKDPLLKDLATMAQTGDPAAVKRFKDREVELWLMAAPELMLGGSATPSATGARSKADAILGKQ